MIDAPIARSPRARLLRLSAPPVWATVLFALVLNVCLLPLIFHPFDIFVAWIDWARASHGAYPWDVYRLRPVCNYPAVWPYLLTALERVRLTLHLSADDTATVYLFKLPGMIGQLVGIPLVYRGLRRVTPGNGRVARRAALLYALCPALLVDGVLWGQIDTLLCLGIVGATLALLNRRPLHAGAWLGFALSVKLQAIIAAPALAVYAFRRFGVRALAGGAAVAVAVIALLAAPYFAAGVGGRVTNAYSSSVGLFPNRTVSAANLWMTVNLADAAARHKDPTQTNHDGGRVLRGVPVTEKTAGLVLFGATLAAILVLLYRHAPAAPWSLPVAGAASVWAFFCLCTQMHERYGVPAAALLTLAVGAGAAVRKTGAVPFALWAAISIASAWNQFLVLDYDYCNVLKYSQWFAAAVWVPTMTVLPFVNLFLLAWMIGVLGRARQEPPLPAPKEPT